ncbi:beta-lactamase-like protein [Hypoxylon trugodes]|uniref:beta-lactamase-like protein n=1 Tax=Hypoxylon trugodes TaxID=326681 RepID=UPI0021912861|nr:beta-lactamase-like protein [Hypoxylon trugodes]KAI1390331.1 beta-lactamase-like protein [Hypoxylon trugodes]
MPEAPNLNIPASASTVNVSIVNTTGTIYGLPVTQLFEPAIPGHDYLATPIYSFLIQHPALNRTIVFDLGIRKDFSAWPEGLLDTFKSYGISIDVPKHIREILDEQGVDTKSIEAVVWSHPHLDHTGDPSTFEPSTTLIVGPGVKKDVLPGYPAKQDTFILEADYAGREVKELDFTDSKIKIGKFPAIDYFGDGSFYFLDAPGHCIGHICGLARVTSNPDSFILMGGDIIHHSGELRPHHWHPLPDSISPHPFELSSSAPCPGELFHKLLRDGKEEPFYYPAPNKEGQQAVHFDPELARESIKKLQEVDAHDNILVAAAHEQYLLGVADFFPKPANDFLAKGWVQKTRWAFLADLAKAAGYEGKVEAAGDYTPRSKKE